MQQLTEHFKFSSRHGGIRPSFSLRPILRWPRPLGLDQRRMGAIDENIVLIRFYRKKFTLAKIHPTGRYQRFLPTTLAMLSGFAAVGCDEQKPAGEASVASEMQELQKPEQQNQPPQADVPKPDDWQQLGGEAIIEPAPLTIDPDDLPTEQGGDDTTAEQ